jgi:hypothetical protein
MPNHFGSWHTVASRYQRWRASGLWFRIRAVFDERASDDVAA